MGRKGYIVNQPLLLPSSLLYELTSSTPNTNLLPHHCTDTAESQLDSPLYPNASFMLHTTLLLMLALTLTHTFTSDALVDLLSLLNRKPHNLPTSVHKFYGLL